MDIFTKFKQALKIREVHLDNNVFQLHYRVTALLLLCCAGLVASKQHFGDPIDCITKDDVPNKIMDTYCWIHSTFTLPSACNKTVGVEVAHPCVDKFSHNNEERVYHKYYQWVYFVLFFQAAFFYAPHFFWKAYEAKLLCTLTKDLQEPLFDDTNKELVKKAQLVAVYLRRHRYMHQRYYAMFAIFELSNLLNVIGQMYVIDHFLGGTFTTYGLDVISHAQLDQDDRVDPMVKVFPRMTKCTFHRFGSSGDVMTYDSLCILPLNIINEKIFIIMWFWFVFLALVTGLWLVYRALTFVKPGLRYEVLRRRARFADERELGYVLEHSNTGDWFLLSMLCKNMGAPWFKYVIELYSKALRRKWRDQAGRGSGPRGARQAPRDQRRRHPDQGREPMLANEDDYDEDDEEPEGTSERGSPSDRARLDDLEGGLAANGKREPFDGVTEKQ